MPRSVYGMTYRNVKSLMEAAVRSAQKYKIPGAIAIVNKGW